MEREGSRPLGTILWRRKWIVVLAAVLALGASIAVSLMRMPQYQAKAVLVREQQSVDVALFGTAIYPYEDVQRDLVTTAEALASKRVAELVKESLGLSLSTDELLNMVDAEPSTQSNTISVGVVGSDPREAALIVDEFAKQTILIKQESDKNAVAAARQALEAQLALMTSEERESDNGQDLQTRIEQLKVLEGLQTGGYSLWQSAQVPESPIAPRPIRDGAAGLAVGLVLGLIAAVVIDRLDRRLKEQADFEREFRLPILALLPQLGRKWKRGERNGTGLVGFANTGAPTLEAYRLLRSNLQYFEVEKGLRSILVTSGLPNESKTVTTTNLALSLALSGAKVVLVDSDLRNPLMHRYLGLDNSVGLSTVLAGGASVEEATKVVKLSKYLPSRDLGTAKPQKEEQQLHKDLLCLTSGPLPPNPAELLASPKMEQILKNLCDLADHVLLDSAPVLLVADAVSLAPRVDGVIIVSRAGTATIDQAREVRNALDRVGARSVGVVISGVKSSGRRGYGHGYYHTDS